MTSAAPSVMSSTSHGQSNTTPSIGTGRGRGRANGASTRGAKGASDAPTGRRQSAREPKPRRKGDEQIEKHSISVNIASAANAVDEITQDVKLNGARRTSRSSRSRTVEDGLLVSSRSRGANGSAHQPPTTTLNAASRPMGRGMSGEYAVPNGVEERWISMNPTQMQATAIGGPGVPFARGGLGLSENPGRTIYSQQRQPNR